MGADTLIFRRKNGKSFIKIVPSMHNKNGHENCWQEINLANYKDIALFFEDLEGMWNAPIRKAVDEYIKQKDNPVWPF